ncbi:hypothetical protein BDN70DRAFT_527755 [Pholiota conissans]|uniref:Uncharacterized protein n=1 Tax=Pholiota conissans TaxID=109636 RepID=A0A9P5YNH8_9AGAR|nr:hypothetical protein BDN70DRAFT_527755 [Pholiota conissans]
MLGGRISQTYFSMNAVLHPNVQMFYIIYERYSISLKRRSWLDCCSSLISRCSVLVLITSRLYVQFKFSDSVSPSLVPWLVFTRRSYWRTTPQRFFSSKRVSVKIPFVSAAVDVLCGLNVVGYSIMLYG